MVYPVQYVSRSVNGVPVEPSVIGDLTGRRYWTIADALAGEGPASDLISGLVPQVGTSSGVIVGPGALSAVDDFYNGYIVVNTDTTPSNGLVCRYATVIDYIGATRTLNLDQPWDFVSESTFSLISPIRISLEEDLTEDLLTTLPSGTGLVLNLQGHRLDGYINGNQLGYLSVRSGTVGKGFDADGSGSVGVFIFEDVTIEPTEMGGPSTMQGYAIGLAGSGVNVGRCIVRNCRINGFVAGRRGHIGWEWTDSIPLSTDDVTVRFIEAVAGVTITLVALDVEIDSTWAGAMVFATGAAASVTGATAYMSIRADIRSAGLPDFNGNTFSARRVAIFRAEGAATLTSTVTSGSMSGTFSGSRSVGDASLTPGSEFRDLFSVLAVEDFTGTATVVLQTTMTAFQWVASCANLAYISIEGTDMTGTVSLTSSANTPPRPRMQAPVGYIWGVLVGARLTSGVTLTTGGVQNFIGLASNFVFIDIRANQDSAGASVTVAGASGFIGAESARFFGLAFGTGITVSDGSYTISCPQQSSIYDTSGSAFFSLPSTVSGGTFLVSGVCSLFNANNTNSGPVLCLHTGTGGTLTSSGGLRLYNLQFGTTFKVASATGAGASVTVSGNFIAKSCRFTAASSFVEATTSTSTAVFSNTLQMTECRFDAAITIVNSNPAGAAVTGPSAVTFEFCMFNSTLTTESGSGTITWASSVLSFRNCHVEGLFTLVGTRFSTVESFNSTFNGNASQKSISATGTRPTTYRHWYPVQSGGIITDLFPEIIRSHTEVLSVGAIAKGSLAEVNASVQAAAQTATGILRGVVLIATAGAAERTILVTDGEVFVDADATVVAGNNLVVDTAGTPTEAILGTPTPGNQVGFARENTGTTVAGEAYSTVLIS